MPAAVSQSAELFPESFGGGLNNNHKSHGDLDTKTSQNCVRIVQPYFTSPLSRLYSFFVHWRYVDYYFFVIVLFHV